MISRFSRTLLGYAIISLLATPLHIYSERGANSTNIEKISAIALFPTVVAANVTEVDSDLKSSRISTTFRILASTIRLTNDVASLENYHDGYSKKYKIIWTAWDAEQLIVDLWELFGSPKITSTPAPADPTAPLSETELDQQISTLSYTLRVIVLPAVESCAACYAAWNENPSDQKSLKLDACVHSLKSLSRLTSNYLVSKKASTQEKLYLAAILCNICLCAHDLFYTIDKPGATKENVFKDLGVGREKMGELFKKNKTEETKVDEPKASTKNTAKMTIETLKEHIKLSETSNKLQKEICKVLKTSQNNDETIDWKTLEKKTLTFTNKKSFKTAEAKDTPPAYVEIVHRLLEECKKQNA